VLFEKLQDQYAAGTIPVQDLLFPVQVELGHAEKELLAEYLPGLNRLGLLVEEFGGPRSSSRPSRSPGKGDHKRLLIDIIDEIKVHGKSGKMDALRDDVLSVMACHPAIKVHRRLSMQEMEASYGTSLPAACPTRAPWPSYGGAVLDGRYQEDVQEDMRREVR